MRVDRGSPPGAAAWVPAVLALVLFAPGLAGARAPVFRDLLVLVIPLRGFARQALRSGSLPLWTDDLFFGAPFLADYQSAVLYPPSLLIYALPFPLGLSLFLAFHLAMAGWGMARYLEVRRGLGAGEALFGGVVFASGGFLVSLIPLTNQLEVAAWLPWLLLAGEELVASGARRWFFALLALVSLQALGGAPEALVASLLLLVGASGLEARRAKAWARIPVLLAAVVLALFLCAAQLLPTAEYAAATERARGLDYGAVTAESLAPRSLLQFLLPHAFTGGGPGFVPEGGVPLFWSFYVGIAPITLAALALAVRPVGFWAGVLWLSLLLSLGPATPIFPTLHHLMPRVAGAFRFPAKLFLPAHFALALLAARGLEHAAREARGRRGALVLAGAVALAGTIFAALAASCPQAALGLAGYALPSEIGEGAVDMLGAGLSLIAVRGAVLALLAGALLWQAARGRLTPRGLVLGLSLLTVADLVSIHRPLPSFAPWRPLAEAARPGNRGIAAGERIFHYCTGSPGCLPPGASGIAPWSGGLRPAEPVADQALALAKASIPDLPMLYGVGAVAGSDGFATRDQQTFFRVLAELPRDRAIRLLAALGVGHLVGPDAIATPQGTRFEPTGPPWHYELVDRAPRTYFAERLFAARDIAAALARMAAADFRPGRDAVTIGERDPPENPVPGELRKLSVTAGRIEADVVMPAPGLWVVGDTWFAGWRATVDGAATEVLRVNGVMRGIRIDGGAHHVEMRYVPRSFRTGCLISAVSAFVLIAAGGHALACRRAA
jgi:hypothetical protein